MHPTSPHDPEIPPGSHLEDVLAEALHVLERDGEPALERFLAERPADAPQLREALADLRASDLLLGPRGDVPDQLGDFLLGKQLGAGGMGIVYAAEQLSLGRQVALKVVRPELLFFEGARERFRREIEAVARLEHPAIVPILATGTADGIPYYAMPLLRGRSAEAVLKELASQAGGVATGANLQTALGQPGAEDASDSDGAFRGSYWQAAVRLVRRAALGIHHAHQRGVLHRDLKPSNLMLTADGRAIVLDFGLAQARGDARLTRTGSQAGSPAYMAPEQVRGEPADERTDVYGLAATLHCLLGLRPPFATDDPEQLRRKILAGDRQELRGPALPPELHLVLDTAMDVDRMRRYATAEAFADDLEAVLEGRPIQARRLPIAVRLRRYAQRHRTQTTAAIALGVFLVVLPAALLWQQRLANVELAKQVARADQSLDVSIDTVEKLLFTVAEDRLRNLPAAQEVAAEQLREAIALFDRLAGDAARAARVRLLQHRALARLIELEASLGHPDAAAAVAERTLDLLREELDPAWRVQRASVRRQLAVALVEAGRFERIDALLQQCIADLHGLEAVPDLTSQANNQLGFVHGLLADQATRRGDADEALRCLRQAVHYSELAAVEPRFVLWHGMAQVNLSKSLRRTRAFDEALQLANAAEATADRAGDREFGWPVPRTIRAMATEERARILQLQGQVAEAERLFHSCLDQWTSLVSDYPQEPGSLRGRAVVAHELANLLGDRKDYAAARPLAEQAIRDQLAVLARNPNDAEALRFLGNHRRTLCHCLRHLDDDVALETESRAMGKTPGVAELPGAAARNLLRLAEKIPDRADALRTEALDLLVETVARGGKISSDDPLYAPLLGNPRFKALLPAAK